MTDFAMLDQVLTNLQQSPTPQKKVTKCLHKNKINERLDVYV